MVSRTETGALCPYQDIFAPEPNYHFIKQDGDKLGREALYFELGVYIKNLKSITSVRLSSLPVRSLL